MKAFDTFINLNSQKLLPKCIEMLDTPEIDAKTVRFVNYGLMRYAEMEDFDVVLQVLSKLSPLLHKVITLCSLFILHVICVSVS